MATPVIQPVVLCRGSGTGLWPLSRKQFVPLIEDKSLLALTLERFTALATPTLGAIYVAAGDHRYMLRTEVTCGKETFLIAENESSNMPLGEVPRLHNPGKSPLEMIEV